MGRANNVTRSLLLSALVCGCAPAPAQPADSSDLTKRNALFAEFSREYQALDIPALGLSFAGNIKALESANNLARHEKILSAYQQKFTAIETSGMSLCQKIDLGIARHQIDYGLKRARLGQDFLSRGGVIDGTKTLSDVPLSKRWYGLFLEGWHAIALNPDKLFAFGERELKAAVTEYDAIQAELGFAGDDAGLRQHLEKAATKPLTDLETQFLFRSKQITVRKNLHRLFPDNIAVPLAAIKASDRGASFPVPGYYEQGSQSFFYNGFGKSFDARQADWLFLHEATPGHHYQLVGADIAPKCKSELPTQMFPAFSEGWAAYVENLGEDLGLYRAPEERLAAVEWNMVRSARVSLDIGLNSRGWSDQEALNYWHQNVRGQHDIAQREIDRMRRWPAQVITYKYGASVFQEINGRMKQSQKAEEDLKKFHGAVIGYGNMPVTVFARLLPEMLEAETR